MIRLKRKSKGEDFPEDVCAYFKCEEPSAITLGAGLIRPFSVPLCDKHNDKRCKEKEDAQRVEPAIDPVADQQEESKPKQTKDEREAAWRAKIKAEKTNFKPPKPPKSKVITATTPEPELPPSPDLEGFINAPLREEPKAKSKCKPEAAVDPKLESDAKPPKPSGNGNGTIPLGALKRALIANGAPAAEIVELGHEQAEAWIAEHFDSNQASAITEKARKLLRTPRSRPRPA